MTYRIKKIAVCTVAAAFFLAFAFIFLFYPKNEYIENEKRYAAKLPSASVAINNSADYSKKVEEYLCDSFALRSDVRSLYTFFEYSVLSKKEVGGFYTEGDFVIESVYPQKDGNIRSFARKISQILQNYAKENDNVGICIVPDKAQYSNSAVPNISYKSACELLYSNIDVELLGDVNIIDIYDMLTLESYYHTDIHWRLDAIAELSDYIIRTLDQTSYKREVMPEYKSYKRFKGSSALSSGFTFSSDELLYIDSVCTQSASVQISSEGEKRGVYDYACKDMYEFFIGDEKPLYIIQSPNAKTDKKLVVFRDSFARAFSLHALEYYSEIVMIDLRWVNFEAMEEYANLISDADNLLFMVSTVVLNGTFVK